MQDDTITISTVDGFIVARVTVPHFEESHAQALLTKLSAAAEEAPATPVLLDLSRVASMPSMVIGAMVTLWKKFQDSKQRFILVGLQQPVRNTLAICRLDRLFEMADNEEAAKKRVRPA